MTAPERSLQQRRDALKTANEVRAKRAKLKRDIAARRTSAPAILANPPAYVETMKVWDLLLAIPKVGRAKASQALKECRVSPSKTVGGLSERQRVELAQIAGRGPDRAAALRYQAKITRARADRASGQPVV